MLLSAGTTSAHDRHPYGTRPLDWTAPNLARVLTSTQDFQNGAPVLSWSGLGRVERIDGRDCLVGAFFMFDVDDAYAFDIDEPVTMELEVDGRRTSGFTLIYDHAADAPTARRIAFEAGDRPARRRESVTVERARFANRLHAGTDFGIAAPGATVFHDPGADHEIALCGLTLRRSGDTPPAAPPGRLVLRLTDAAQGAPVAARVGLYDPSGRMPLPGDDAVTIHRFTDRIHQLPLTPGRELWPGPGGYVFYVDGAYRAMVPAGRYVLYVARGPEYRIARRDVVVGAGGVAEVDVALERWQDMPARRWYSGDGHVHIGRDRDDNPALAAQMRAEDLHVTNLLQMSNVLRSYFPQYAFGAAGHYAEDGHTLVSGQESPRTGHRGHTIGLGAAHYHHPERYFLYHEVARAVRADGGLFGYAHVMFDAFNASRGLALDVPSGLVDFVEVLQFGALGTEVWYDFLNLGFRLNPIAGSDFPYIDSPGAVRSYVAIDGEPSPAAWFEGLGKGRTFVTSGPLLELSVDGQGMGAEVAVSRGGTVDVEAVARFNPDYDRPERLELVVHGDVVARATAAGDTDTLRLAHALPVIRSCWLAIRAFGHNGSVAHSAPVYLAADGVREFWKRAEVSALARKYRDRVEDLLGSQIAPHEDLESWSTGDVLPATWREQRPLLHEHAASVLEHYDALAARAGAVDR